jgi:hypothetical protein
MGFGFFTLIVALTPVGFYASNRIIHILNGKDIELEDDMLAVGGGIIIATLAAFLTCLALLYVEPEYKTAQYESERIYSLPMHPDVDGRFCLGAGMIKHRQYYYYFYKSKSGGYAVDKMEAAKATIYENDAILPCIRRRVYVRDRAFYKFFLGKELKCGHEIVVPKGFTINNFFNANR